MSLSPLAALLSRKRLLIFDLDGTLVDSSPLHARAFADTMTPLGVTVEYSRIAGLTTGRAIDQLAAGAGLSLSAAERDALIAAKRARALALIAAELEPFSGAPEFVRAARARFATALCTSASRANALAALGKAGLDHCFGQLVTAEDVVAGKPDPEPFLAALDRAGVTADEALVFEDAPSGLAAAAAAGIDAVQVLPGSKGAQADRADWPALNAALRELA